MKLRLPSRLVQALLTTCAGVLTTTTPAFADIPEDYTQVVISSADDLNQYSSSYRYAFLVKADIIAATHMYGASQYWSSLDLDSQRLLTFSGISSSYGGAISATTLTMEEFEKLMFSSCESTSTNTSTSYGGGAIYNGSTSGRIDISRNGSAEFTENQAAIRGGAICSDSEIILFENDLLSFDSNSASQSAYSGAAAYGGAIYSTKALEFKGNLSVRFSENHTYSYSADPGYHSVSAYGGAIYCGSSTVTFSNNESVTFNGNYASANVHNTSSVHSYGGAIYGGSNSDIVLNGNTNVTFDGNYVFASIVYTYADVSTCAPYTYGGAIYGGSSSNITLHDNESVTFSGNYTSSTNSASSYSYSYGGAIYGGSSGNISLCGNGSVAFSGNHASGTSVSGCANYGGAIYGGNSSNITFRNNESVTFNENHVSGNPTSYGGAIYGESNSIITLSDTGSVSYTGNYASAFGTFSAYAYGGAIYGESDCIITLSDSGSMSFTGNSVVASASGPSSGSSYSVNSFTSARSCGGAIVAADSDITICGNESVIFEGNSATSAASTSVSTNTEADSYGGAIHAVGSDITICGNESIIFAGNSADAAASRSSVSAKVSAYTYAYGGAIYAASGLSSCSISIEGNGNVEFRGNYEKVGSSSSNFTYRLRGLYQLGNSLKLSAGEGQSIAFYDGIYTGAAVSVSYNGKYVGSDGNEHAGTGDILMSGVHAEEDLYALKQDYTQSELDNSRLFEINGTACLYGGRLRVEDHAVYKGAGIDIVADSNAVLRVSNASLVLTDGITVGANAKITGRHSNEISTSDGIDISEPQMRGAEGMGTLSNVNVDIIDDYTIENMSISGSVIDISEGKHLYVKHVNIAADARITDEAAWLDMVDTHGWLDNTNTVAEEPVMSLGDTLFYRSGDDAWMRLDHDVSYVALTSELFSNVIMTGSDLWLDLTGLADTIGDARAFSIAFKNALYDVNGLHVVATVDGEHYLDGYYTTKQEGTTTTLYFSSQIPEPATGTLSLLALAALAARRRRK